MRNTKRLWKKMKKISELNKRQKIMFVLCCSILILGVFLYFNEVLDESNYTTVVNCADGRNITYEGKKDINIDLVCGNNYYKVDNITHIHYTFDNLTI